MAALEELENYGAFSDEGIMPGCHSKYDDYDIGVKPQYYEWLQEVGHCITDVYKRQMYIRIASNDFFSVSRDVVSRMITGEYDAE